MALTEEQKTQLLRKGNQLFNEGRFFEAGKIFTTIGYKDGLIRLGDYFFFDKEMPLVAYGFYRNAGHAKMLDRIGDSFVFALECLLGKEPHLPKPATGARKVPNSLPEESLKIRSANPYDTARPLVPQKAESKENKIERAMAMLKKHS